MKNKEVQIGATYVAKVSGKLAHVRITGISPFGGWDAVNTETKRGVRIRGATRLRRLVSAPDEASVKELNTPAAGLVYSVKVDDTYRPMRVESVDAHGMYRMTEMIAGALGDQAIRHVNRDALRGTGQTVENWEKQQAALKSAAEVATQVLGIPVIAAPTGTIYEETEMSKTSKKNDAKEAKTADVGAGSKKPAKAHKPAKERKPSGLDAAVTVLAEAKRPMTTGEMVARMLEVGLWKTSGKTPASTIYAAIIREIATKGKDSRFHKTERGKFELTK